MKIAYSKTRERFPLSYKKIIKKTVSRGFRYIILLLPFWLYYKLILSGLYTNSTDKIEIIFLLPLIFLIVVQYLYQRWYFATYFYDLTDDFIQIKKGPITPHEITLPYERIQDVYVDQDLLDRIFGLYDVHISTATLTSGIQAHIDGLEKEVAENLRNEILKIVQQKITKKTL